MVRFRQSRSCNVWHIASTRALGVVDCWRRSRSRSRNPPVNRRLKNATPKSHASTSQGKVSREAERPEIPVEVLAAIWPTAAGCVCATDEDPAGAAVKEGARKKNVATG